MGRRALKPDAGAGQGSTLQKDKFIEAIALSMAEGKWEPFRSVRELAARERISLGNAQAYAAEASRLLRISWGGEDAKLAVLERIRNIGKAAEERTEEVLDAGGEVRTLRKPDYRTALRSAETLASILGLQGSNAEVVIRYQNMSDAELYAEAQRLLGTGKEVIDVQAEEPQPEQRREQRSERAERREPAAARATLDRIAAQGTRARRRA